MPRKARKYRKKKLTKIFTYKMIKGYLKLLRSRKEVDLLILDGLLEEWQKIIYYREISKTIEKKLRTKFRRETTKKMKKIPLCSMCGKFKDKIQLHHVDYNENCEIVNLCESCHHKLHAKKRRQEINDENTTLKNKINE